MEILYIFILEYIMFLNLTDSIQLTPNEAKQLGVIANTKSSHNPV